MPNSVKKAVALEELKKLAQRTQTQVAAVARQVETLGASVPTKVSELTNDSKFQTDTEVAASIQTAISASGHAHFEPADAVPEPAAAKENTLYLVMNAETGYYDIYAKVGEEVVLLDDTTVDLSGKVDTEEGKGLSANDYTDAEKTKLAGVAEGATKVEAGAAPGAVKINGTETPVVTFATDAEVAAMLDEVFGAERA